MTVNAVIALLVLPAITFGLLYHPALTRVSPHLASPYPKASTTRRFVAAAVDGTLVTSGLYFSVYAESVWFLIAGLAYAGLRDAIAGRSVGKFFAGLMVIRLDTRRQCSAGDSLRRNVIFCVPGMNVVALVLEAATALRDPHGYRLGDRLARSQVIEGYGARDLAESFIRWWTEPVSRTAPSRRRRVPGAASVFGSC
jgi:hypothetical protein